MYWRQYANKLKQENKDSIYTAMTKRELIQKEDHLFIFLIDNIVQHEMVSFELANILSFMRESLKNDYFSVEIEISIDSDSQQKYLSPSDQFNLMARTNPNLYSLKKMFGLEFE